MDGNLHPSCAKNPRSLAQTPQDANPVSCQLSAVSCQLSFISHKGSRLWAFPASQKHHQNQPKSLTRSIQNHVEFCIDFWNDFLSIWVPLAPSLGPKSIEMGRRYLRQGVPGTDWAPKASQEAPEPKMNQNGSHLDPRDPQNQAKRVRLRSARHPNKKQTKEQHLPQQKHPLPNASPDTRALSHTGAEWAGGVTR